MGSGGEGGGRHAPRAPLNPPLLMIKNLISFFFFFNKFLFLFLSNLQTQLLNSKTYKFFTTSEKKNRKNNIKKKVSKNKEV